MTPADSLEAKVNSLESAIPPHRLYHVIGTGGIKAAATGKQGGYEDLIELDKKYDGFI